MYRYQQRLKFPFQEECNYQTFRTWNQRYLRSWVCYLSQAAVANDTNDVTGSYVNNMAGLRGKQTWKHEHVPPLLFLDPTCYGIVVSREVLLDCSCPWLTSDWRQKLPKKCPLVNSNLVVAAFCRPWRRSLSQDLSSSVQISIAKGKYFIKNKTDMIRFVYRNIIHRCEYTQSGVCSIRRSESTEK